jgi:RNA 2',3'-cyclic 3'-phosphodiesterase
LNAGEALRLFVAAPVPEPHLRWVAEQVAGLRSALPEARWTDVSAQHLTLKFLGTTPPDKLDEVAAAVATVAAGRSAAPVSLTATGAFPDKRRARVFWMGLDDSSGLLEGLAADLDRALRPLGYTPEKRAFTPHLTLARFKSPTAVPGDASIDARSQPAFDIDSLILWRSRLHPAGARYEEVEAFDLKAGSRG